MSFKPVDEKQITLKYIDSKPASRAKNFLIWQYLQQDITPLQADKAYKQVLGNHPKIYNLYTKKTTDKNIKKKLECQKRDDLVDIKEYECFRYAYSLKKALKLPVDARKQVEDKLKNQTF